MGTTSASSHLLVSEALHQVWCTRVKSDYQAALIASERELQACVYSHLRAALTLDDASTFRVFVEPSVRDGFGRRLPDLIVASPVSHARDRLQVIAVIELKLDRGAYIRYEGELDRIERMHAQSQVTVADQRPHSDIREFTLELDEHTRYYLGFVGRTDAAAVYPEEICRGNYKWGSRNEALARKVTLLYGRVDSAGMLEFGEVALATSGTTQGERDAS